MICTGDTTPTPGSGNLSPHVAASGTHVPTPYPSPRPSPPSTSPGVTRARGSSSPVAHDTDSFRSTHTPQLESEYNESTCPPPNSSSGDTESHKNRPDPNEKITLLSLIKDINEHEKFPVVINDTKRKMKVQITDRK